MKRNKIIWVICLILSLVGISFFGGAVSYGFFAFTCLIPVTSFVYLLLVNSFFKIYQQLDTKRITAGHVIPFQFDLINECFFGFSGVSVRFFASFSEIHGLEDGVEYELQPHTGIQRDTGVVCKYRGEYEVGIQRVEIRDFFGLFHLSYKNPETLRVVVRPDLIYLERVRNVEFAVLTSQEDSRDNDQPDVLVREYYPGDDVRKINWKLSAKHQKLMTREWCGESQRGIGILMSTKREQKAPECYLPVENKILECCIALGYYYSAQNIPTRVLYDGGHVREHYWETVDGFRQFYDAVAEVEFREEYEMAELMQKAARSGGLLQCRVVFLILDEWLEEINGLTYLLNQQNIEVVVYLIGDHHGELPQENEMLRMKVIEVPLAADLKEVL